MKKIIDFLKSDRFYLFGLIFSYFLFLFFWFSFFRYSMVSFKLTYNIDKFVGDIDSFSGTFQDGFLYCQYSVLFFVLIVLLLYSSFLFFRDLIMFIKNAKERSV